MRVPTVHIYRAFPELDKFSDKVCQNYVRLAKRKHLISLYCTRVISLAVSVFVFVGGMFGWLYVLNRTTEFFHDLWLFPIVGTSFGAASLLFLLARDIWLRWALRQHLTRARCGSCDYSLLGLPIADGAVTCPECGTQAVLNHLGLTPADLIAPDDAAAPA